MLSVCFYDGNHLCVVFVSFVLFCIGGLVDYDGSERSFVKAIHTLQKCSKMSGLNMNYDKIYAVWIGSRRRCQIRFIRDMNFCWDPGIFKVLGILNRCCV